MAKELHKKQSIWMSYILRHGAMQENVAIDKNGWVKVDDLINKAAEQGHTMTLAIIKEIVNSDSKGRYALSDDELAVRANQGHSMQVDAQLVKAIPPAILYHGTDERAFDQIKNKGINKMSRLYVHLSEDLETARRVGSRHGKVTVIVVDCEAMVADGIEFFKSANGVWLVDYVNPKYFK